MINTCLKKAYRFPVCVQKSTKKTRVSVRYFHIRTLCTCATYCAFVLLSGTKGAHESKGVGELEWI